MRSVLMYNIYNLVAKVGTSSSPSGEFLNFDNPPPISPATAAKIASRPIAQNRRGHRNTKPLAIRRYGATAAEIPRISTQITPYRMARLNPHPLIPPNPPR